MTDAEREERRQMNGGIPLRELIAMLRSSRARAEAELRDIPEGHPDYGRQKRIVGTLSSTLHRIGGS